MNAVRLLFRSIFRATVRKSPVPMLLALPLLLLFQQTAYAQSANLDQGANEKATTPVSPVDWINGNLNANQAHFLEGYSVPYRAVLQNLVVNQTYTLVIGFDVRNSSKQALDYLTHYQRLNPHNVFSHGPETVDPLLNISGFPPSYFTTTDVFTIPAPSSAGSPVSGQPTTSFNALPAGEKLFTGYNADITNITYASQGSLTAANSETVVNITFTALKATAVLAWGGHIASIVDWGKDPVTGEPNSASAINGSPYHMRLKNWIINGNVVSIGNQDRSLKTDAVFIPPTCSVSGPVNGCVETNKLAYTATVDDSTGLTYAWSIIGANTANAKIVNPALGTITVVPIGTAFTVGTFNLRLIVTREGLKDTCYLNSHTSPGANVTIAQVTANAGSDQTITNLDTAHLSASATGGTGTYTFTWTPVTGLSNPNIKNPDFIPPSTGVFQFVVKADDGNCQDLDTVVITVNQHANAPCGITGPSPVCPGAQNQYSGPAPGLVGSYLWSVTGDGTVSGANNTQNVLINAATHCGSYQLRLIVSTPDGKKKDTCYLTAQIKDSIKPVLSGQVSDANVACTKDVPAAPVITVTDNCTAGLTVQTSTTVSDSTCANKYKITRKWWATDLCGNTSDTLKQVITVNDIVKPVITASFDKTVNVQCLKDVPAIPSPTASDNCVSSITPVYSEKGSGAACDSTITRKWVFTDACGNSDSVTQVINIKDDIKPILSGTAGNVNVTCSKDIPAAANITATDNCDLKPAVYFKQQVTDSTCVNRFKVTRKWWAIDACGNKSDTITQVITVYDDVKPVITATFSKTVNVQCTKDIPAVPNPTATDNCNGSIQPVYSAVGSGTACDSTITRKWIFTDACGNSDSVTQVIYIKDNTAPVVSYKPANKIISCTSPVVFDTPIFTDNCGSVSSTYEDRKEGTACPFKYYRKWTAKDNCNNSVTFEQVITVACCAQCTYTQGFYGNPSGSACTPSGTTITGKQIMSAAVDAQPGDSVIFGLKSTGKFFTLYLSDITNNNIYKMLPGGGTPVALKGYATFTKTYTWGNVPLLSTGKINNILLSQTMSLFFNMYLTPTLKDLQLKGDTLLTVKPLTCGSSTLNQTIQKFAIPPSVVNYLNSVGKATVAGLYELANIYLGGQTVPGVVIGDVSKAVDAINRAFDGCAALVGWTSSSSITTARVTSETAVAPATDPKVAAQADETTLNVTVFPNPYNDKVIFRFVAPATGQVKLEVYNVLGQQIGQLNYGMVDKGTQHTIVYDVPSPYRDVLLYRLNVGEHFRTGKVIPAKK